ncbi:hypothetical protein CDL12_20590 [Handroanthus impetiginosus]|uniref:Uncharacterized protein n=1 Tax=Handroanthus impetiginosus TaxID=429701 RepID=A0A2G9GNI2_9LAMI|nr:hypothetical protein CDL12_20590 [Handroanthus impetiginosus]
MLQQLCSAMDTFSVENIKDGGMEQLKSLSNWDNIRVPGLRSSMSMTDLVSHLEHRISEQGASNGPNLSSEEWESLQILDNINRCLLSDVQSMPDSDEKFLMSRVNSLCCLLQKDTNVQSKTDDRPDMSSVQKRATDASDAIGASASEQKDEESYRIVLDQSNDISGQNQTGSMSRKDSVGDLLLNLPRIASLPQFLFNISEDYENQAR